MRLSVRLSISLVLGVALVSMAFALYQTQSERHGLKRELERHAVDLAVGTDRSAAPVVIHQSPRELQRLVDRFENQEHLAGVAVYDSQNRPLAMTSKLSARVTEVPTSILQSIQEGSGSGEFFTVGGAPMHVFALPIRVDGIVLGALAVFHDTSYIVTRSAAMWQRGLATVVVQTVLIVSITLLALRWGLGRPVERLANWLRDLRTGSASLSPDLPEEEEFKPLKREATRLASSLTAARAAAEHEARLRDAPESEGTAERLRISVEAKLV